MRNSGIQGKYILQALFLFLAVQSVSARHVPTINREKARHMATMQVVYNDRVAPFNTLARDFTTKIYGSASYRGLCAEQVVCGWLARPDAWKDEPMILVKDPSLRRQLGISGRYARMADLFVDGHYRLPATLSATDKAVRELDEKVGLILMLTGGTLIVPRPADVAPLSPARVKAELLYNQIPFSKVLFMLNLSLGLLGFVIMLWGLARGRSVVSLRRSLVPLLLLSFLFYLSGYLLRWYVAGHIPLGNGNETMQFLALAVMLAALLLSRRFAHVLPFGFLLSGFAMLVAWLGERNPQITPLMPVLSSPLLSSHVSLVMSSYALLAFMMLNGFLAWVLHWVGGPESASQIEAFARLSRHILRPAVFLLAVGIFLGAVWANVSWGRYWSWDPKEVWALITLMVYAVPFHAASIPAMRRPLVLHAYLAAAFLVVLMTYFGVNYFLGGMHAYA